MDDLRNRWLQERMDRSRNVPPEFYHYTSAQGLIGIIRSYNMWATDVRYLNDEDEITYGQRLLDYLLATYQPPASWLAHELLTSIPRSLSQLFDLMEIYVTCMCTRLDLATHWRGYGGQGGTYAITFDSQAAARGIAGQPLPFSREPVEYDETRQRAFLLAPIRDGCELLAGESDLDGRADLDYVLRWFSAAVRGEAAQRFTVVKDPRWQDEREWRYVIALPKIDPHGLPILHRESRGQQVPYLAIQLRNDQRYGTRLPILRILRGPVSPLDLTEDEIADHLRRNGYSVPPIEDSLLRMARGRTGDLAALGLRHHCDGNPPTINLRPIVDEPYISCKNGRVATRRVVTAPADGPDYAALYLIAEGQRGYFTTHQARQTGISDRLLTHWVKTGRFRRVAHGIYRLRDSPATPREELMIPLLWAGPDSALSHETSLELYGLADVLPTTTHLTVPASFTPRPHAGVTPHHEPLSPNEVVLRDDFRLTTVERTLVDCCRWGTDRDQLSLAARQVVDRGLVNARRLQTALDEAGIAHHFDRALVSNAIG